MPNGLTVDPVRTKADFDSFLKFPWSLYADDPYWVPPLLAMQRHKLDRARNVSWRHMEGEYFLARRGERPVGTVAGFINHRHNEFQHEHIGFFGMFEVENDPEAAHALLEAAAEWVRVRGYDGIRGPASFSTNEECGLLIKGFDDPPVILMPYNPSYYQDLIASAPGFEKVMDVVSYKITLQDWQQTRKLEQTLRVTAKNNARRGIEVRTIDGKHVARDLEILKDIYNNAWDDNWGFVPLADDELNAMFDDLGQYIMPELGFLAEVNGEPAAFLLAIPDMNQPLKAAYSRPGKPHLLALVQALWHWKLRTKITRIRVPLMGVKASYRGIGVEGAMFAELFQQAIAISRHTGWTYADAGWVLETNDAMKRLVDAFSGDDYKHYRWYERAFSP